MKLTKITVLMLLGAALLAAPAVSQEAQKTAAKQEMWEFVPTVGGDEVPDLLAILQKETGVSVVYDPQSPTIRGRKILLEGKVVVPKAEIFNWIRSLLSFQRLFFVPVGPEGGNTYALHDLNSPAITTRPIHVPSEVLPRWADKDGVYIVTTVSLKHLADTARARNALAQLSTRQIGRINDVPESRSFVIGDFAPVVFAQWMLLQEMDLEAAKAPPVESKTPPAAGAVSKKSESELAIERYEQLLATSPTANAAQYFLAQIAMVRARITEENAAARE